MRILPPDRDPELRHAFALNDHEQCALLNRMLGDESASSIPGFTFEPIGVTLRRTAHALSCVPTLFPNDEIVRLGPESSALVLLVNEDRIRRSAPRTSEAIADLEALVARCVPSRGILRIPFAPPRTWTWGTVQEVVGLMRQHLPEAPSDPARILMRLSRTRDYEQIEMCSDGHTVVLENVCGAHPDVVWKDWYAAPLPQLEAGLATLAESQQTAAPHTDADEDDDDLDPLERAARRILHGHGAASFSALKDALQQIARSTQQLLTALERNR